MSEVAEYKELCANGCSTPLYSLIRRWIYAEYDAAQGAKPWRIVDEKSMVDGRIPNMGLAGPFQTTCG